MTYLQILNTIKDTALAQPNVNSVVREFLDLNREDAKYSAVVIQDRDGSRDRIEEQDYVTYTWHLGYVDRLTYDESNRDDIISTGINIINNIVNTIRNTWFPELEVSLSDRINTFDQRFTAQCAGVYGVLSVNALVSDCIDSESGDIYDKFKVEITENGDYHFVPSGKPVDEINITVDVAGSGKEEVSLTDTVTLNGTHTYTPAEDTVYNNVELTVDVHPTDTLSRTYVSNGSYNITGEWKDAAIKVEVPSDKKPEESLIETITSNGSHIYSPEEGSVFSGANITVDVHPSISLSKTYTTNGEKTITGEFNGGVVTVDVHPSNKLVKTITSNGITDLSGEWKDASIEVDVHPTDTLSRTYVSNGSYDITGEFNGGVITVNVHQSVTGFTEKEIAEGVKIINLSNSASFVANGAFASNSTIQTVNLPYATTIGEGAFETCKSLTQVDLPVCSYLDNFAFRYCYSLSQVSLPMCSYIDYGAFYMCSSLTQVSLPVCIHIGNWNFYMCSLLSQVSLPVCNYIGMFAFRECSSLTQVDLPMCSYIGEFAFVNCISLSIITIGYSRVCSLIESNAFEGTPIASGTGSIYVPISLVDAYKSAAEWSYYSSVIFPIS